MIISPHLLQKRGLYKYQTLLQIKNDGMDTSHVMQTHFCFNNLFECVAILIEIAVTC